MAGWLEWLIAATGFVLGARITSRFLLRPLALGAVVAGILDAAGAPGVASWVAFIVVSTLILLVGRRRRARSRRRPSVRTDPAALIGAQATVLERIANDEGVGCVTIGGEVWTARALAGDQVIERGTRVQVVEIKGATALVSHRTATDRAA